MSASVSGRSCPHANARLFRQQIEPRTFVVVHTVNSGLNLEADAVGASPDYAEAGLFPGVENSDHISRPQFCVHVREQSAGRTDTAGLNFLDETLSTGVDAAHAEGEAYVDAWFVPADHHVDSWDCLLNLAPDEQSVQISRVILPRNGESWAPIRERINLELLENWEILKS